MGGIVISKKMLDKYFGYLKYFDDTTKKNLIIKLSESMESKTKEAFDINSIFGAWKDDRSSDEIIDDIKNSRVEKRDNLSLE